MSKQETGPIYGVPLIDSMPVNRSNPDGWMQAMPSRDDLLGVKDYFQGHRVVAGYKVLLNHWREQGEELAAIRERCAELEQDAAVREHNHSEAVGTWRREVERLRVQMANLVGDVEGFEEAVDAAGGE